MTNYVTKRVYLFICLSIYLLIYSFSYLGSPEKLRLFICLVAVSRNSLPLTDAISLLSYKLLKVLLLSIKDIENCFILQDEKLTDVHARKCMDYKLQKFDPSITEKSNWITQNLHLVF